MGAHGEQAMLLTHSPLPSSDGLISAMRGKDGEFVGSTRERASPIISVPQYHEDIQILMYQNITKTRSSVMYDVQGTFTRVDEKQDILMLDRVISNFHDSLRIKLLDFLDDSLDQRMFSRDELHS